MTDSMPTAPPSWWTPFLLIAAGIAAIPSYGYFVHANREGQIFFFLLATCWGLSFIHWVIAVVAAVLVPAVRKSAIVVSILLLCAIALGFGGLRVAFDELLAG